MYTSCPTQIGVLFEGFDGSICLFDRLPSRRDLGRILKTLGLGNDVAPGSSKIVLYHWAADTLRAMSASDHRRPLFMLLLVLFVENANARQIDLGSFESSWIFETIIEPFMPIIEPFMPMIFIYVLLVTAFLITAILFICLKILWLASAIIGDNVGRAFCWFLGKLLYIPNKLANWHESPSNYHRDCDEKILMLENQLRLLQNKMENKNGLVQEVATTASWSPLDFVDYRAVAIWQGQVPTAVAFKIKQLKNGKTVLATANHVPIQNTLVASYLGSDKKETIKVEQTISFVTLDLKFVIISKGSLPALRQLKPRAVTPGEAVRVHTPNNQRTSVGQIVQIGLQYATHSASTYHSASGGPVLVPAPERNDYYGLHYGGVEKNGLSDSSNYLIDADLVDSLANLLFDETVRQENYLERFLEWADEEHSSCYALLVDYHAKDSGINAKEAISDANLILRVDIKDGRLFYVPRDLTEAASTVEPILRDLQKSITAIDGKDSWYAETREQGVAAVYAALEDPASRAKVNSTKMYIHDNFVEFNSNPRTWLERHGLWAPDRPRSEKNNEGGGKKGKKNKRAVKQTSKVARANADLHQEASNGGFSKSKKKRMRRKMRKQAEQIVKLGSAEKKAEGKDSAGLQQEKGMVRNPHSLSKIVLEALTPKEVEVTPPRLWGLISGLTVPDLGGRFEIMKHGVSIHDNTARTKGPKVVNGWVGDQLKGLGLPPFDFEALIKSFKLHTDRFLTLNRTTSVLSEHSREIAKVLAGLSKVTSVGDLEDGNLEEKLRDRVLTYVKSKNFAKVKDRSCGVSDQVQTKGQYMGLGTGIFHNDTFMRRFVEQEYSLMSIVRMLQRGEKPEIKIKPFIKKEPHKKSKLEEGRYRIISGLDVVPAVLNLALADELIQHDVAHWRDKPWCIGADLDHAIFGEHFQGKVGSSPHDKDKSGWDWTVNELDVNFLKMYFEELYGARSVELAVFMSTFGVGADCTFYLPKGVKLQQKFVGLLKTGWALTLHVNSVLQVAYQMAYHASKTGKVELPLRMLAMGDDAVFAEKIGNDYNAFWSARGKIITDASENEKGFCSRRLLELPDGRWVLQNRNYAKSLFNLCLKKPGDQEFKQMVQSFVLNFCFLDELLVGRLRDALRDMGFHDAEFDSLLSRAATTRIRGAPQETIPVDLWEDDPASGK